MQKNAVRLVPDGSRFESQHLDNLANCLLAHFENLGEIGA